MAVIGKIRERSTLVLIIIGGAIIAFVLSDLFSSSAGGQQGPINLAEVDGATINPQEYENQLQRAYENYEAQTQQPLDERTKASIRENVFNQMVSDIVIGREMKDLGVKVTTKELFDMVQGNDPHPQVKQAFSNPETGEFNSAAVVQFLQNLDNDAKTKDQWVSFERALKSNQRMDKYNNLIKKGLYTPTQLAAHKYTDNNVKLNFDYVYQPYTSIVDSTVELSEAEIKTYYEENKADFEQTASRKVFYAFFPVKPSEADVEMTRKWAEETAKKFAEVENDSTYVNANSDNRFDPTYYSMNNVPMGADTSLWSMDTGVMKGPYMIEKTFYIQKVRNMKMAPDSVQARHILVSTQQLAEEQAEAKADSLIGLLESGSSFEEIAKTNSDDPGSAEKGGDLGWFSEGMMVKPFNDAAFSSEIGEIKKVKSQFGFHIIEVTDKTAMKKKIQIATIQRTTLPGKETYADLFNEANSFSIDATDGETFNNMINENNLQRRVATLTEKDNIIQGFEASRDLVRWAKDAEEGAISEAFDIGDAFAVAYLESVNEEGPAPLDKVSNRVEYLARQKKKAQMIMEEFKAFSSLEELANSKNLEVKSAEKVSFASPSITGVGLEPKVVGKAMSLEQGQTSVPLEGNNGVFVIKMKEKISATNPDVAQARASESRGLAARIDNAAIFNALKEKADLNDNRSKFY